MFWATTTIISERYVHKFKNGILVKLKIDEIN